MTANFLLYKSVKLKIVCSRFIDFRCVETIEKPYIFRAHSWPYWAGFSIAVLTDTTVQRDLYTYNHWSACPRNGNRRTANVALTAPVATVSRSTSILLTALWQTAPGPLRTVLSFDPSVRMVTRRILAQRVILGSLLIILNLHSVSFWIIKLIQRLYGVIWHQLYLTAFKQSQLGSNVDITYLLHQWPYLTIEPPQRRGWKF